MASSDSNNIQVTPQQFKDDFPEFNSLSDTSIEGTILEAGCYISTQKRCDLSDTCLTRLIELMAAHLLTLNNYSAMNGGMGSMLKQSATIGSVSVTNAIPTGMREFANWIWQTSYGQRYWAMLKSKNATGFYFGGSFQRKFSDNMIK